MLWVYQKGGVGIGLTPVGTGVIAWGITDGSSFIGCIGYATSATTFILTDATYDYGYSYSPLDYGSRGNIENNGYTLNTTIVHTGTPYGFNGFQWVNATYLSEDASLSPLNEDNNREYLETFREALRMFADN
jgi:hypothetical protein